MSQNAPSSGGGLFGSSNPTSNLFNNPSGNFNSNQQSGSNLFGSNAGNNNASGGLFGGGASSGNSGPGGGFSLGNSSNQNQQNSGSTLFGSLNTPNKTPGSENESKSLFASTGGNGGSSTPTNKPLSFGNQISTTPAGPPPTSASGGLFGSIGNKPGGLFANQSNHNSSSPGDKTVPSGESKANNATQPLSGSSLFGNQGSTPNTGQTTSAPSLFGNQAQSSTPSSLFGNTDQRPAPTGPAFGNKSQESGSSQQPLAPSLFSSAPPGRSQETAQQQSGPSIFSSNAQGNDSGNASNQQQSGRVGSAPQESAGLFGGQSAPQQQSSSLFGNATSNKESTKAPGALHTLGGASTSEAGSGPSVTASSALGSHPSATTGASGQPSLFGEVSSSGQTSSSLFDNAGAQKDTQGTPREPSTSSAPMPKGSASGGLFGGLGKGAAETENKSAPAATNASTIAGSGSTAGPAPSGQSRLKNKSMDEIMTRWASDLSKYQKEFQAHAEKVAVWDRLLVENSSAISRLYSKTFQAERDTAEVQKQLSAVEGHQDELAQWLDKYERDVDEMMSRQLGQGETLQGPDQERERTYVLQQTKHPQWRLTRNSDIKLRKMCQRDLVRWAKSSPA